MMLSWEQKKVKFPKLGTLGRKKCTVKLKTRLSRWLRMTPDKEITEGTEPDDSDTRGVSE